MEINIRITEKDLDKNPEIIDALKLIANSLREEESNHVEESTSLEAVQEETPVSASDPEETAKTDFLEKKFNLPEQQEVPAEETPAEAETDKTEEIHYSQEDVRKAVSSYAKKHSAAQAKAILMNHGASKVTDLDPAKYEAVIKECEV